MFNSLVYSVACRTSVAMSNARIAAFIATERGWMSVMRRLPILCDRTMKSKKQKESIVIRRTQCNWPGVETERQSGDSYCYCQIRFRSFTIYPARGYVLKPRVAAYSPLPWVNRVCDSFNSEGVVYRLRGDLPDNSRCPTNHRAVGQNPLRGSGTFFFRDPG